MGLKSFGPTMIKPFDKLVGGKSANRVGKKNLKILME